jgi:hypothetical protein
MCDDVQLCNCCVRELLILARTWFAFDLPSKTRCDRSPRSKVTSTVCASTIRSTSMVSTVRAATIEGEGHERIRGSLHGLRRHHPLCHPSLHFEGKEVVVVLYSETEVYYPLSSSWDFSFSTAVDLGFTYTQLVLVKPRLQVSWVLAFWSVLAKPGLQVSLTVCALLILI